MGGQHTGRHRTQRPVVRSKRLLLRLHEFSADARPRSPLCFKKLLELEEPVQDSLGFVYEKAAILSYIKTKGKNGAVDAPSSGVAHQIRAADLVPAKAVIRASKKQAHARERGVGGGGAGAVDVYIDEVDEVPGPSQKKEEK